MNKEKYILYYDLDNFDIKEVEIIVSEIEERLQNDDISIIPIPKGFILEKIKDIQSIEW